MRNKGVQVSLAMVLLLSLLLSACSEGKDKTADSSTGNSVNGTEPLKELTFPDAFPEVPKAVDPGSYDYDDMSKHYDIEVALVGNTNTPASEDPIADYLNKQLNISLKLTNMASGDLINKITVRFASAQPPDLTYIGDKDVAFSLYKQGQLVDALEVLPYMPQMMNYVTKDFKNWSTLDGHMVGIPRYSTFPPNWGLFIRQDWLKQFGMSMPTTEDELFAYAKAVVEKDPNKNNKADTYFMGTGANGQGFGMMDALRAMYGHTSWNVVDGTVNHPMLDGSTKRYLEFVKKLNDNKLLSPDWYTIGWEQFKSYTLNDQIGMVNYPGFNLLAEQYTAKKNDPETLDYWAPIQPLKSNDGKGGMNLPTGAPEGLYLISKEAAKDPGKLKRIAHFLDSVIYPNVNYWAPVQGGGPEIYPDLVKVEKHDNGTYTIIKDPKNTPIDNQPELKGAGDWQNLAYSLIWEVHQQSDLIPYNELGDKYNLDVMAMPRYKNYDMFLTLDGPTTNRLGEFIKKNEIAFVLGKRSFDEWDKYVDEWKRSGGDALIKQVAEQLKVSPPK
ncbi:extracellular solute-binding protein [Paenibacillus sp. GCM10027626]|uniref:extracellular solute-binding protein n=1 Tax=Paenibacillus sp. GCM10027626 TaxID=3273411 RepID=UPI003643C40C